MEHTEEMKINTEAIAIAGVVLWIVAGLSSGYLVGKVALGADTDLPIRVGIWNLDNEPISSLAFSECNRHGFPCKVQCRDAPIVDVVNACVKYEMCCGRAGPYLDNEQFGGNDRGEQIYE